MLRETVLSRLQMVYGVKWENSVYMLKNECERKILEQYGDNEDFDPSDHDWKDWIEVSDYKKIIEKNFSDQRFVEAFAINIGLPFKTKKEKLAWITMIETKKGKKQTPLTRSDINYLWRIQNHLSNFVETNDNV